MYSDLTTSSNGQAKDETKVSPSSDSKRVSFDSDEHEDANAIPILYDTNDIPILQDANVIPVLQGIEQTNDEVNNESDSVALASAVAQLNFGRDQRSVDTGVDSEDITLSDGGGDINV